MEDIDTEYLLLIPLLLVSIIFTVEAMSYPAPARRIPLAISIPLTVLVSFVLLRKIHPHLFGLISGVNTGEIESLRIAGRQWAHERFETTTTAAKTYLTSPNGYTLGGTIAFIIASYYIGLIVTAPLFMFIYMVASRVSVIVSFIMGAAAFGIIYFLMDRLHLYDFLGGIFF